LPENPASYRVVRKKSYLFNKAALELTEEQRRFLNSMLDEAEDCSGDEQ